MILLYFEGYAKDGGLYVCEFIPTISKNDLHSWKELEYPEIVKKILRLYISETELTDSDIEGSFSLFNSYFNASPIIFYI